jgi:hypothetical protein
MGHPKIPPLGNLKAGPKFRNVREIRTGTQKSYSFDKTVFCNLIAMSQVDA